MKHDTVKESKSILLNQTEKEYAESIIKELGDKIPEEMALCDSFPDDILLLSENGFDKSDLLILGTDIRTVAGIIRYQDIADVKLDIEMLRDGWVNSRPSRSTGPDEHFEESIGLTPEEAGMLDALPNRPPPEPPQYE